MEAEFYALTTGDIEIMSATIPPELEAVALVDPDISIHEFFSDYIMYLGLNQRRYPMNVLEFRQAVQYGINRTGLIEIAYFGTGLECPASMSLPYGTYYDPTINPYDYSLTTANALLDGLGFLDAVGADGIREDANGTDLTFELIVSAEYQASVDSAKFIKDAMVDIGIDVVVTPILFDVLWQRVGGPGGSYSAKYDYDWSYLGWVGFWSDFHPNWAYWMFSADLWWGSDDVNIPGWSGAARDAVTVLTDDILSETNETLVQEMLDEVQQLVADDLPYNPMVIMGGKNLYRNDKYTGWIMGNTTGINNWQSLLAVHLMEPEEGAPGFGIATAVISVIATLGAAKYLKKKRK